MKEKQFILGYGHMMFPSGIGGLFTGQQKNQEKRFDYFDCCCL